MGRRLQRIGLVALAAVLLHVPAASAGSGDAGSPCVGDGTEAGATMIGLNNQGSSEPFMQPHVPPEGNSVITSWRVQVAAGIGPLQQQLVVSRQVGEDEDVRIAESALETVVAGSNEFAVRIPVHEFDHLGLWGPDETLICHVEGDVAGRVGGSWEAGEQRRFDLIGGLGVPVIARAEEDRDNDGYGDATQDGCPASSALQTPCPLLTLTTRPKVKPNAILVRVTASNETSVQVLGQVSWRDGKRLRIFGLGEKTPRMLPAATTGVFRLRLWKAIKRHLEQLSPKQSLRAKLSIGVTDVFGAVIRKRLTVRLHGRSAPR